MFVVVPDSATHVLLLQILSQDATLRVPAALIGLTAFVDNLRLLVEAQQAVATAGTTSRSSSPDAAQQAQHGVKAEEDEAVPMDEGGAANADASLQGATSLKAVTGARLRLLW